MLRNTVIVILLHLTILSSGQTTLTRRQSIDLAEFKELVKNDLTQEYMAKDKYLVKWLRKGNFNVTDSLRMFHEYLEWRAEQKMDTILQEDWSDMRAQFPYSLDTVDKSGRPILYYDFGDSDFAGFLVGGGQQAYDRFLRYALMYKEDVAARIRQLRSQGSNVTNYRFIMNAGNYAPMTHSCELCVNIPGDIAALNAKYLPPVESEETMIINVPNVFKIVLPENSRNKTLFYGQDRAQWEKKLLESIDLDQFPSGIFIEPKKRDNSEGFLNFKQFHYEKRS